MFITDKELQQLLNVTRQTTYNWRQRGLKCVKIGKTIRFEVAEVENWLGVKIQTKQGE